MSVQCAKVDIISILSTNASNIHPIVSRLTQTGNAQNVSLDTFWTAITHVRLRIATKLTTLENVLNAVRVFILIRTQIAKGYLWIVLRQIQQGSAQNADRIFTWRRMGDAKDCLCSVWRLIFTVDAANVETVFTWTGHTDVSNTLLIASKWITAVNVQNAEMHTTWTISITAFLQTAPKLIRMEYVRNASKVTTWTKTINVKDYLLIVSLEM